MTALRILLLTAILTIGSGLRVHSETVTEELDSLSLRHAATQAKEGYEPQYLPMAIPPTPQASALARYGEYPVSHTTGIPDISIPIYVIDLGGYTLPITLSYHASGFRPDDIATTVGLGWVLNAGGAVSRAIMGAPDFEIDDLKLDTTYRNIETVKQLIDGVKASGLNQPILENLTLKGSLSTWDCEADRFSFNIPGHNGIFRYNHKTGKYIPLNYSPVQIIREGHREESRFTIYTPDNARFYFNEHEKTGVSNDEGIAFTSSWYLTKIMSPHNGTISFYYDRGERYNITAQSKTYYAGIGFEYVPPTDDTWGHDSKVHRLIEVDSYSDYVYKPKLLSSISWAGGSIEFVYVADRKDMPWERLSEILVMDNESNLIKKVSLDYFYWGDTSTREKCRMMLSSVKDSSAGTYRFSYNGISDTALPRHHSLGHRDYWGFYTSHYNNRDLYISKRVYHTIMEGDAHKQSQNIGSLLSSDFNSMSLGVLSKIEYPTGGHTSFTYEANNWLNYYTSPPQHEDVGGLRIKSIESDNLVKEYEYSTAFAQYDPDCQMIQGARWGWTTNLGYEEYNCFIANISPTIPISRSGSPVFYSRVVEKSSDGSRTVYDYDIGRLKDETEYPLMTDHPSMLGSCLYDEGADTPLLLCKTLYDKDSNKILTEEYTYNGTEMTQFSVGTRIVSNYMSWSTSKGGQFEVRHLQPHGHNSNILDVAPITAVSKVFNNVKKRITDHISGVTTEQRLTYDHKLRTLKPRSIAMTGSNGAVDSIRYEYPFDRDDETHIELARFYPDAMLAERHYCAGRLASTVRIDYIDAFPDAIYTSIGDGPFHERERLLSWNMAGHPEAVVINATDTTRIIWDKNGLYPLKVTHPGGLSTSYTWQPLIGVSSVTDARGYRINYNYDKEGRLCRISDSRGTLTTHSYAIDCKDGENSVSTNTHIDASGNFLLSRQFYDGLGRPTSIARNGLNTQGTFVHSLQTYDSLGRIARTWLPVVGSTSVSDVSATEIQSWSESTYDDSHAFSSNIYDGAGRLVSATTPGDVWHAAGKSRDIEFITNDAGSVKYYTAPVDNTSLVDAGYYAAGSLNGNRTTDEDGNSIIVFSDKAGRKVLERRGVDNDTYFVYNDYGQLRYVLSPQYQQAGYKDEYAYEYRYDTMGNVVKKFFPGCGYTQYWYDGAGRIIFLQDPTLRQAGLYRFFLYDAAGRPALQGLTAKCNRSSSPNPVTLSIPAGGIGSTGYVMADPSRISSPEIEIATYYDSYTLPQQFTPLLKANAGTVATGLNTASLAFASDGTPLATVYYYDSYGRVIQTLSMNIGGRECSNTVEYTFTDNVKKNTWTDGNITLTTENQYCSKSNLLLSTSVTACLGNRSYSALVASYTYDGLGRLSSITHPDKAGTVAYSYNLHGRLTSIESPTFSQRLHYADGPGKPLYNGCISSMLWKTPDHHRWRGYRYSYNDLGWLTRAEYGENENVTTDRNHYTLAINEYSANGSIKRMQRHGLKDDGLYGKIDNLHLYYEGNRLVEVVEDADAVTKEGATDFNAGAITSPHYTYNTAGLLTSDINRGITSINYDHLQHPVMLNFSGRHSIGHTYSAAGEKLRTVHSTYIGSPVMRSSDFHLPENAVDTDMSQLFIRDTTDYVGPVIYTNGSVERILFDGGYITVNADGSPTWHYFTKDYIGSVRTVVNTLGAIEQINHYYPFGATFADAGTGSQSQPYRFGGKEFDAMYGLHWHDFGARWQSPQLGCFTTPDPLNEKYPHLSPYLFCANDPVNNTDPSGMEVWFKDFRYEIGIEYKGDDKFIKKCVEAMNMLYKHGGEKLVQDLIASENIYKYIQSDNELSSTTGTNGGDVEIKIADSEDEVFFGSIVHESMHVAQFHNGLGGAYILNEVEAYTLENVVKYTVSIISSLPKSLGIANEKNSTLDESLFNKAMDELSRSYDPTYINTAIISFKRGAEHNNSGLYDKYRIICHKRQYYETLLQKYDVWKLIEQN